MMQSIVRRSPRTNGNFQVPFPSVPLAFTGERMTTQMEGMIEIEHYHRYCLARDLVDGLDVLDVASGEGYGSALLAGIARSVIGVEIDPGSVAHAAANYAFPNLSFLNGDALDLPIADATVDVVVSFETLEHVADHQRFLSEVRRVLRPGGLLIVSTPDRSVYSAEGIAPNLYHVLELTAPEFNALLAQHFANHTLLQQRAVLGSAMSTPEGRGWRSYDRRSVERIEATDGLARADYLIALASDGPLPEPVSSIYLDRRRVHDAIEALQNALGAAARIADAEARALSAEARAVSAEARAVSAEARAVSAEARAESAEAARIQLLQSASWRVTGPLRRISRIFR